MVDTDKLKNMYNKHSEEFKYLEELRQSNETNMFGAVPYLQNKFNLNRYEAKFILKLWMEHYSFIKSTMDSDELNYNEEETNNAS